MSNNRYRKGDEPVPGYRLIDRLGKGAFGEVWKARRAGVDTALKIVPLDDEVSQKEFSALKRYKDISHTNIVDLTGIWLKDDNDYLLGLEELEASGAAVSARGDSQRATLKKSFNRTQPTELILAMTLGEVSLYQRLEQCVAQGFQGIPPDELLEYMAGAARALDHLNLQCKIQHCDIKPANILKLGDQAKVCDLGIAREFGEQRGTRVRTTGMAATVAYAPPELLYDNKPTNGTDQYSLAITYLELRTGKLPFSEQATQATIMEAHKTGNLDLSALPEDERPIIRRATSVDPARRYTTCADMVKRLRKACPAEDASVGSVPPGTPIPVIPIVPQRKGDTVGEAGRTTLPNPGGSARPERRLRWTVAAMLVVAGVGGAAWYFTFGPGGRLDLPTRVAEAAQEHSRLFNEGDPAGFAGAASEFGDLLSEQLTDEHRASLLSGLAKAGEKRIDDLLRERQASSAVQIYQTLHDVMPADDGGLSAQGKLAEELIDSAKVQFNVLVTNSNLVEATRLVSMVHAALPGEARAEEMNQDLISIASQRIGGNLSKLQGIEQAKQLGTSLRDAFAIEGSWSQVAHKVLEGVKSSPTRPIGEVGTARGFSQAVARWDCLSELFAKVAAQEIKVMQTDLIELGIEDAQEQVNLKQKPAAARIAADVGKLKPQDTEHGEKYRLLQNEIDKLGGSSPPELDLAAEIHELLDEHPLNADAVNSRMAQIDEAERKLKNEPASADKVRQQKGFLLLRARHEALTNPTADRATFGVNPDDFKEVTDVRGQLLCRYLHLFQTDAMFRKDSDKSLDEAVKALHEHTQCAKLNAEELKDGLWQSEKERQTLGQIEERLRDEVMKLVWMAPPEPGKCDLASEQLRMLSESLRGAGREVEPLDSNLVTAAQNWLTAHSDEAMLTQLGKLPWKHCDEAEVKGLGPAITSLAGRVGGTQADLERALQSLKRGASEGSRLFRKDSELAVAQRHLEGLLENLKLADLKSALAGLERGDGPLDWKDFLNRIDAEIESRQRDAAKHESVLAWLVPGWLECQAEIGMPPGGTAIPPEIATRALELLDLVAAGQDEGEPYFAYAQALWEHSVAGRGVEALKLYDRLSKALESLPTFPESWFNRPWRKQRAIRILVDAAHELTGSNDPATLKRLEIPLDASTADRIYNWLKPIRSEFAGEVGENAVWERKLETNLLLAAWYKEAQDLELAKQLSGELVSGSEDNLILVIHAEALQTEERSRALESYLKLFERLELPAKSNGKLRGQLYEKVLTKAIQIEEARKSDQPGGPLGKRLGKMWAYLGLLYNEDLSIQKLAPDAKARAFEAYDWAAKHDSAKLDYVFERGMARLEQPGIDARIKLRDMESRDLKLLFPEGLAGAEIESQAYGLMGRGLVWKAKLEVALEDRVSVYKDAAKALERAIIAGDSSVDPRFAVSASAAWVYLANFDPFIDSTRTKLDAAHRAAKMAVDSNHANVFDAYDALGNAEEDYGWLLNEHEHYANAISAFGFAIENAVGSAQARSYCNRGRCQYKQVLAQGSGLNPQQRAANLQAAMSDLTMATSLELAPTLNVKLEAEVWLSRIHGEMGDFEQGQELLDTSIRALERGTVEWATHQLDWIKLKVIEVRESLPGKEQREPGIRELQARADSILKSSVGLDSKLQAAGQWLEGSAILKEHEQAIQFLERQIAGLDSGTVTGEPAADELAGWLRLLYSETVRNPDTPLWLTRKAVAKANASRVRAAAGSNVFLQAAARGELGMIEFRRYQNRDYAAPEKEVDVLINARDHLQAAIAAVPDAFAEDRLRRIATWRLTLATAKDVLSDLETPAAKKLTLENIVKELKELVKLRVLIRTKTFTSAKALLKSIDARLQTLQIAPPPANGKLKGASSPGKGKLKGASVD